MSRTGRAEGSIRRVCISKNGCPMGILSSKQIVFYADAVVLLFLPDFLCLSLSLYDLLSVSLTGSVSPS